MMCGTFFLPRLTLLESSTTLKSGWPRKSPELRYQVCLNAKRMSLIRLFGAQWSAERDFKAVSIRPHKKRAGSTV
jgi:hypothetical protein